MSFLVDPKPLPGRALMARDAALFEILERGRRRPATLRLYRWARPTVSFGYAQIADGEFDLAALRADGVPWVRRPTGGRAILHADEWTYSVAGSLEDPHFGGTLRAAYAAVTTVVRAALVSLGVPVDESAVRAAGRPAIPRLARTACFAAAWGHEITVRGRKLAGSAQRRGRRAFLQQGTILVGDGHQRLARYTRLGAAERRQLEAGLASSAVTVSGLLGPQDRFPAFAAALAAAWRAAGGFAGPLSLDREEVET